MSFRRINGDWVRWALLVALVCATQFTDLRYVSKTTYSQDAAETQKSLAGLKETVANLSTAIALLQQTARVQDDHENRLRSLERKTSKLNANYESFPLPFDRPVSTPDLRAANDR